MNKLIIIMICIIIFGGLLYSIGRIIVQNSMNRLRTQVLETSLQQKVPIDKNIISALPPVVRRYFNLVLPRESYYIQKVNLSHTGTFKSDLDKDWVTIDGEQIFTTERPQFHWVGKTSLFTATDGFIADEGSFAVYLLGCLPIIQKEGAEYDSGELLRWLGESVWFPTNLLPSENLSWSPIDEKSALLTYTYNDLEIYYTVTFNQNGEICKLETQRHMGDEGVYTWIGLVSSYRKVEGMLIPMDIEAIWVKEETEFPYARFSITDITYDFL